MTSQPKNKSKTVKPKAKSAVTAEAEPWPTETLVDDGARPDRIETPPLAAAPPKPAAPPKIAADPWTLVVDVAPEGRTDAPPVVVEVAPAGGAAHAAAAADGMAALVAPGASGLYRERPPGRGELRLDVDGPTRLMVASGVVIGSLAARLNWIARVKPVTGTLNRWSGTVSYRDGAAALLPQTAVDVTVTTAAGIRQATARFSGGGMADRVHSLPLCLPLLPPGRVRVRRRRGHHARPDRHGRASEPAGRPAGRDAVHRDGLPPRRLHVIGPATARRCRSPARAPTRPGATRRCTTRCRSTGRASPPSAVVGVGLLRRPARRARPGRDHVRRHRPEPAPGHRALQERVHRERAGRRSRARCLGAAHALLDGGHEMGHAFNLAHSWQKSLGTPWIPLADEPRCAAS